MTVRGIVVRETSTWPNSFLEMAGWNKCNCTAGRVESHGYQGLPKGSVRVGYLGNQRRKLAVMGFSSAKALFGGAEAESNLPAALWKGSGFEVRR
jgi:hypothetical protein